MVGDVRSKLGRERHDHHRRLADDHLFQDPGVVPEWDDIATEMRPGTAATSIPDRQVPFGGLGRPDALAQCASAGCRSGEAAPPAGSLPILGTPFAGEFLFSGAVE